MPTAATPTNATTRVASRSRPDEHLHIESGALAVGPIERGWLSAQWAVEPIEPGVGSPWFRFRNLWQPERYVHAESGAPEAGPIAPGWLSAQWRLEPLADAAFVRVVNRNPLVRWLHVESGALGIGKVEPGWLSAQWLFERVPNTAFFRLRNRWKTQQCLHIEGGRLESGPVGNGWLSAMWSTEKVPGTAYVRLRNRWKPEQCVHIEGGTAEAGPIAPGWLSAMWLTERVPGTSFVRLRNRWEVEPCLFVEGDALRVGLGDPAAHAAHWLPGSFRRRVIATSFFQRRFDTYINQRESPLFGFRIDDNEFSLLFENPLTGEVEPHGEPVAIGDLEVPLTGNNIRIDDLNTDRVTVHMVADPVDGTPEVEATVRFETKGTEVRINNFPDVNLTGARVKVRLRLGFDAGKGLLALGSFVPVVDAAMARAKTSGHGGEVTFRGKLFHVEGALDNEVLVRALLRAKLLREFVRADVAINVSGVPDGTVAGLIERRVESGILDAIAAFDDGSKRGWTPWSSVSEGSSTAGAPISAVVTALGQVALFVADAGGGVYTALRNRNGSWGPWANVSEGSTVPGGHVTALALADGRIALLLADPAGGVYTASGSHEQSWSGWASVSDGGTLPGAPVSAVSYEPGRVAVFVADRAGGVYGAVRSANGTWGPWAPISHGSTTPGGHITALALGDGRIALALVDPNGGVYATSGSPSGGWAGWTFVSEGTAVPGAPLAAVALGGGRVMLLRVAPEGTVYAATCSAAGAWGAWSNVAEGSTVPGGRLSAVRLEDGRVALFIADRSGWVYTNYHHPSAGWGLWAQVSDGRTTAGGCVAAAVVREREPTTTMPYYVDHDRLALALADTAGGIYASRDGVIFRPGLDRRVTEMLTGGEHRLLHAHGTPETLTLDMLVGDEPPPRPAGPQVKDLEPGRLAEIDHIVVLMMENRSFDHMLGYLETEGERTDIDGLQDDPIKPVKSNVFGSQTHLPFPLPDTRFEVSPCHGFDCVARQIGPVVDDVPAMSGFVADFDERARKAQSRGVAIEARDIMGYLRAHQVPVYDSLAREFVVCDHWFCSHPGGTFPNRFYATMGQLSTNAHGAPEVNNPDPLVPVTTKALFDHLSERGVSWRYFEHGYGFLRLFDRYRFDDSHVVGIDDDERGFFALARAGTLPSVSYIDPDFIELPPGNDDHAPADVASGQRLVRDVVLALMDGKLWKKTLLVVTYDEHGGFYDHMPPPKAVPVSGIDRCGVRVPAFVVSPWVDRGAATDTVFDHTSIVKTVARRFLGPDLPDLGGRVAAAQDLEPLLRTTVRDDRPTLGEPPEPTPRGRFAWTPWSGVSEGSAPAGAPLGALATAADGVALFVADAAGGVYTAACDADTAWGPWAPVSEGATVPGGHVTAVADGRRDSRRIALFVADRAGGVYTASGSPQDGWGPWQNVSEGSTVPGAPVAAVADGSGRIALFLADPAGGVYTASRDAEGRWGPWSPVSEGRTVPGGHITAVAAGDGHIVLLLADAGGGIYATSGKPQRDWAPWTNVSEGSTRPGAPISAVVTAPGCLSLFVADTAGGVHTAARNRAGAWGPWSSVANGRTAPGGRVSALLIGAGGGGTSAGRIALYFAGPDGGIYTSTGSTALGWDAWTAVARGRTVAGAGIAAVAFANDAAPRLVVPPASRQDRLALAMVGAQGQVLSARTFEPQQDEDDFHALLRTARYRFFAK